MFCVQPQGVFVDIKSLRICPGPQKAIPLSLARQHHRLKEIGGIDSKLQGGAVTASILEIC